MVAGVTGTKVGVKQYPSHSLSELLFFFRSCDRYRDSRCGCSRHCKVEVGVLLLLKYIWHLIRTLGGFVPLKYSSTFVYPSPSLSAEPSDIFGFKPYLVPMYRACRHDLCPRRELQHQERSSRPLAKDHL